MQSTFLRRPLAVLPNRAAGMNLADLAPLGATILLTAAVFLLPAAGERPGARITVDHLKLSATHIAYAGVLDGTAAHE